MAEVTIPKSKDEFVGVSIAPHLPLFWPKVLKFHVIINVPISTLIILKSPEFLHHNRELESRNTMMTSDFRPEVEMSQIRTWTLKNIQYNLHLCRFTEILASYRKLGSSNMMVNINDRKFFGLLQQGWTAVLSAVKRPTVVTWTLNDSVGHNGLSYGADATFHRTYF